MTSPESTGLAPEQQDEVIELVGPIAWSVHQGLAPEQQVNLARSLRVRGTLSAVAAAVLRAAAQAVRQQTGSTGPQMKRLKDGAEEIEYFAAPTATVTNAELWEAQAQALETQGGLGRRRAANPSPDIEGWGLR